MPEPAPPKRRDTEPLKGGGFVILNITVLNLFQSNSFHFPNVNCVNFRFTRIMGLAPLSQSSAAAQLINIHQLMVEVKKYKPNF